MTSLDSTIRNAVRALVVRDGRVLVQHKVDPDGAERLTLPGGAPHPHEALTEALQRECWEEIGCRVSVGNLLFVADYFKPRSSDPLTRRHQIELIFRCEVPPGYVPGNGARPDKHQVDVVWLPLANAASSDFQPAAFIPHLTASATLSGEGAPSYLGVID